MKSSRHIARLARQLSQTWRSSRELPTICQSFPRATGYLQSRAISTTQTCCIDQEHSSETGQSGETGRSGPSEEARRRAKNLQIAAGSACAFFGASYILYRQLQVNAAEAVEVTAASVEEEGAQDNCEESEEDDKPKKKHVSLHDKHVMGYEDRIRAYSTPDKIFRYFATLQIIEEDGSVTIYMTPEDFLRSITPGWIQPAGLGLDQFFPKMTAEQWKHHPSHKEVNPDSVFARLGNHGLISFSDYLFFLTLLATPSHHFEIAFKMFDLNGDGEVDVDEFETVRGVVLSATSVGHRHRDRSTTGNVAGSVGDALVDHFFGEKRDGRLTIEKFREFHEQLLLEILKLEFNNFHQVNGRISENDFAKFILSYSSMNNQAKKKFIKRIRRRFGKELSDCPEATGGITIEDLRSFTQLLESISDVEMALGMYMAAGASITAADLKSVSKAVAGVELGDHLVEVVITLFDEDGDGNLSYKEFIKTVKSRTTRGLERPKELGFARLMSSVMACSEKIVKETLGIKT